MRLILHQALKDIRAQRWLVAAWLATLLAAGAMEASKLDVYVAAADSAKQYTVPPALLLVALAMSRVLLGWLLAIRIVQADPLDDTGAFWLTRPLSRRLLMASKLGLLAFLFFLVPGAVAGIVFLANNVAPARIPFAVVEWCLFDAVLLLPLVLLATLTRDRARIGLALIAGVAAWACQVGVSTLIHYQAQWIWSDWQPAYRAMALTLSGYGFAIVTLSAGLIVWQYRTRRSAFTGWLAMGIVVVVAAAVLPRVWFDPLAERPAPVVDNRWAGARNVSVGIPASSIAVSPFSNRTVRLVGDATVTGSDDALIDVVGGSGALRVGDRGKTIEQSDVSSVSLDFLVRLALGNGANRRVFERALGVHLVAPPFASSWNALRLANIRAGDYAEFQDAHARYDANLVLAAYRLTVSPPIPVRAGMAAGVGLRGATLLGAGPNRRDPRCWSAEIRESDARTLLPPSSARLGYVLRNKRRGEAVPLLGSQNSHAVAQGLGSSFLTVSTPAVLYCGGKGTPAVDAAWLADAELLMVTIERLGTFRRHVVVPDFVLPTVVATATKR